MFPHLKVKKMGLFPLLLTYGITAKPYGLNQASNVYVPFTIPSGEPWGSSQATGFKDKDILLGNIIMIPDINKHFLTSKHNNHCPH